MSLLDAVIGRGGPLLVCVAKIMGSIKIKPRHDSRVASGCDQPTRESREHCKLPVGSGYVPTINSL